MKHEKYTAGAMRAAKLLELNAPCHDDHCPKRAAHRAEWEENTAAMIDRETAMLDLLELVKECVDGLNCQPGYVRSLTLQRMQTAIARAEGKV